MIRPALPLLLTATLALAACDTISNSRFNPLNWFGPSTSVAVAPSGPVTPLVPAGVRSGVVDGRALIDTVTALQVERVPGGAIVRATGVATTQGQFNAQLVPSGYDGGTLTLAFRVELPGGAATVGPQATREITVARALDAEDLAGVRTIRVQGARNVRTSSR